MVNELVSVAADVASIAAVTFVVVRLYRWWAAQKEKRAARAAALDSMLDACAEMRRALERILRRLPKE